ncbi:MAG: class I SAM-dependent methyltransferase, partial [Dehalococcoidia bacterium]
MADDAATGATYLAYLAYQYGDAERLRVRCETHRLYSVVPDNFRGWVIEQCGVRSGMHVLDVGCGPGTYHTALIALAARVTGCDFSRGMVVEALANSRTNRYRAGLAQASAEALPFAEASFDRAMANHMLYHVPDIPLALREIRRVLRPGGRVVLATNDAGRGRLFELHERAARDCGFTPTEIASARFTLDDLPLVQSVFADAVMHRKTNAFAFPDAEPALRYYASCQIDEIEERAADGSHREPLMQRMQALIEEIVAREG